LLKNASNQVHKSTHRKPVLGNKLSVLNVKITGYRIYFYFDLLRAIVFF
jgi:mRNA-degrading endonuclease RelE of RelBE toxin-antitoxin system